MAALVFVSIVIMLGAAFASASEAALFSSPLIKVRELAQSRRTKSSRVLLSIRENLSRPISAVVVLNNLFNIVGSLAVGVIAAHQLKPFWLGIYSASFTFLVIICSEILPKTIGERYALQIAMLIARPISFLTKVLSPILKLSELLVSPFLPPDKPLLTTRGEIKFLVRIGEQEGIIQKNESRMIRRILHLHDVCSQDIMTPRVSLTSLEGHLTLEECREEILNSQHSRIVVTGESIDDVIGIALRDQLLINLVSGKSQEKLSSMTRPPRFIPTMVRADDLLDLFQQNHEHIAVVVDEFGGVAGVVSLEDVLEVLTGEIVDETDRVMDLQLDARRRMWLLSILQRKK